MVISNPGGSLTSSVATLTVTQIFTGAPVFAIPAAGGTAAPYPALTANVPALTGSAIRLAVVNLTLTHPEPYDLSLLLAPPSGPGAVEFMAGLGPGRCW